MARTLARRESDEGGVIVLDHGPLYRLALLREFGPSITDSVSFREWWAKLFEQWAATLDVVVWLDASNRVLTERIRVRDDSHAIKDGSELQAHDFLDRYRTALERIIAEAVAAHPIATLRFDSSTEGVEQIAVKVLDALDAVAR